MTPPPALPTDVLLPMPAALVPLVMNVLKGLIVSALSASGKMILVEALHVENLTHLKMNATIRRDACFKIAMAIALSRSTYSSSFCCWNFKMNVSKKQILRFPPSFFFFAHDIIPG